MIEFVATNDWWAVTMLVLVSLAVVAMVVADDSDNPIRDGLAVMVIGWTIFNGATWVLSGSSEAPDASRTRIAATMGLETEKAYPVELGSRVSGTTGKGYFYGGVFSMGGYIRLQPGSALTVYFRSPDRSVSLLEIPMSKIKFVVTTGQPTIMLGLDNIGSFGKEIEAERGDARTVVESGYLVSHRTVTYRPNPSPELLRAGLAPLVSGHVTYATIQLPEDMLKRIGGAV